MQKNLDQINADIENLLNSTKNSCDRYVIVNSIRNKLKELDIAAAKKVQ